MKLIITRSGELSTEKGQLQPEISEIVVFRKLPVPTKNQGHFAYFSQNCVGSNCTLWERGVFQRWKVHWFPSRINYF